MNYTPKVGNQSNLQVFFIWQLIKVKGDDCAYAQMDIFILLVTMAFLVLELPVKRDPEFACAMLNEAVMLFLNGQIAAPQDVCDIVCAAAPVNDWKPACLNDLDLSIYGNRHPTVRSIKHYQYTKPGVDKISLSTAS